MINFYLEINIYQKKNSISSYLAIINGNSQINSYSQTRILKNYSDVGSSDSLNYDCDCVSPYRASNFDFELSIDHNDVFSQ